MIKRLISIGLFASMQVYAMEKLNLHRETVDALLDGTRLTPFYVDGNVKEKDAIVLGIPGFNVKPSSFHFAMDMFKDRGIPGFLLALRGCKEDELCEEMTQSNWEEDVGEAIDLALKTAAAHGKKLVVLGHSNGGTYAMNVLAKLQIAGIDLSQVKLLLLAPANALNNEKRGLIQLGIFSQCVIPGLGREICGIHAAQEHLTVESLKALEYPIQQIQYPHGVPALLVYHSNDELMDTNTYHNMANSYQDCKIINADKFRILESGVLAHTFEYLKEDFYAQEQLMGEVMSWIAE